jgi:hypothetical protein
MVRLVLGLLVLVPAVSSAHNCSGPADCEATAGYLTAVGVAGAVVAVVSGLLGSSMAAQSGPGPLSGGPRLIDPDTGEPLVVHDGTYEGGRPGQVWSPFGGWVDPEVAAEHVRIRQEELAARQREIDAFQAETDRQSEARGAASERRAAERERDAKVRAAEAREREDLLRRGRGLIGSVRDPARQEWLEDFLARHADDPAALARAVEAIRRETFEAEQQRTLGESEAARAEAGAYERSERVAAHIEAGAKAAIAATGGAMLAAGASTAAAMAAAASATGAVSGAEAGSESYQRGDSFTDAAANVAAGAAIGALEGAVGVGVQAPGLSGAARAGIRMVGSGLADAADHLRRTGDVRGAAIQGAIGVASAGIGAAGPRGGVGGELFDAATAAVEGGLRARQQGGDFWEGAEAGLTSHGVGRVGGAVGHGAARRASDGPGTAGMPGPGASAEASPSGPRPDSMTGEATAPRPAGAETLAGLAGDPGSRWAGTASEGASSPSRSPAPGPPGSLEGAEPPGPGPRPTSGDDRSRAEIDALVGELERKVGRADVERLDPADPRLAPEHGGPSTVAQGRGISAEEARRPEVWLDGEGRRIPGGANVEDALGPKQSLIRVDPVTGEARVVHGPDVPAVHRKGIEARLLDRHRAQIEATVQQERARAERMAAQQRTAFPEPEVAQAQRELDAAQQRLREAEARLQEAQARMDRTPRESDDYIRRHWDKADAQRAKTEAERAEIEARLRLRDREEAAGPQLGTPAGGRRLGQPDAQGVYDLGADAATDPLARYATHEPRPGFVPQVRPKDCSVACFTQETGLAYEDVFNNLKDHLVLERDATGKIAGYGGLPPANLPAAMRQMGIQGEPVLDVVRTQGASAFVDRVRAGEKFMTGIWGERQDGSRMGGHAIIVEGVTTQTRTIDVGGQPQQVTQTCFTAYDPTRGTIQIPVGEANKLFDGFQHAHFVKHATRGPGSGP